MIGNISVGWLIHQEVCIAVVISKFLYRLEKQLRAYVRLPSCRVCTKSNRVIEYLVRGAMDNIVRCMIYVEWTIYAAYAAEREWVTAVSVGWHLLYPNDRGRLPLVGDDDRSIVSPFVGHEYLLLYTVSPFASDDNLLYLLWSAMTICWLYLLLSAAMRMGSSCEPLSLFFDGLILSKSKYLNNVYTKQELNDLFYFINPPPLHIIRATYLQYAGMRACVRANKC